MIKIKQFGAFQALEHFIAVAIDTFTAEQWQEFLKEYDIDYYSDFNETEFVQGILHHIKDGLTITSEQEKAYELIDDFVCMVLNERAGEVTKIMLEYSEFEETPMNIDTIIDALEELKPDGSGS